MINLKKKIQKINKLNYKCLARNFSFTSSVSKNFDLFTNIVSDEYSKQQTSELGSVVSVGDGIARIQGCQKVQAGELVNFLDKKTKKKLR